MSAVGVLGEHALLKTRSSGRLRNMNCVTTTVRKQQVTASTHHSTAFLLLGIVLVHTGVPRRHSTTIVRRNSLLSCRLRLRSSASSRKGYVGGNDELGVPGRPARSGVELPTLLTSTAIISGLTRRISGLSFAAVLRVEARVRGCGRHCSPRRRYAAGVALPLRLSLSAQRTMRNSQLGGAFERALQLGLRPRPLESSLRLRPGHGAGAAAGAAVVVGIVVMPAPGEVITAAVGAGEAVRIRIRLFCYGGRARIQLPRHGRRIPRACPHRGSSPSSLPGSSVPQPSGDPPRVCFSPGGGVCPEGTFLSTRDVPPKGLLRGAPSLSSRGTSSVLLSSRGGFLPPLLLTRSVSQPARHPHSISMCASGVTPLRTDSARAAGGFEVSNAQLVFLTLMFLRLSVPGYAKDNATGC